MPLPASHHRPGPLTHAAPSTPWARVQDDMPFRGLTKFGTSFLNRFEASILPCEILEKVIFVDTPGVLSGEKQRIGRSYNFVEVRNAAPVAAQLPGARPSTAV